MWDHWGYGFGGLWHAFSTALTAIGALLLFGVLIALAVLLARYLLVATKAAELYLAKNGDVAPPPATAGRADAAPAAPTTGEPVGSEAVTDVVTPPPPPPPPKPRTPRKPPAAL